MPAANSLKVLALTRYGRLGASSRLRTLQYIEFFRNSGITVDVSPLFGDAYVKALYSGERSGREACAGVVRRAGAILRAFSYDLVWIEKEAFPFLPTFMEKFPHLMRVPYIIDLDDAVFHRYDRHSNWAVRSLLGRKIDDIMHDAAAVSAGSPYLQRRALAAGAARVELIPTAVDLRRYDVMEKGERISDVVVGWIGSPVTAGYLGLIAEALCILQRKRGIKVRLIGARLKDELPEVMAECLQWSETREVAMLSSCDIGVMPLPDDPWERGKCGYKLIQYMACGLPVVASPVGVNAEIVVHGESGYLAESTGGWVDALDRLVCNPALRRTMGRLGRQRVAARYCTDVVAPRIAQLMWQTASE